MNFGNFALLPVIYVALVLLITNILGYMAVTHFEQCGVSRNIKDFDMISTYACFGISFVFVTIPTITAPDDPRKQMSAVLIFLWAVLYMISVYYGVYDRLSVFNETEWIRWVAISFLCLLPHTMGLTWLSLKHSNRLIRACLVAVVGLIMMTLSSWRTVLDAGRTTAYVSIDSWWGNFIFWLGIFLLNAPAMTNATDLVATSRYTHPRCRISLRPRWIISFVCGPGLILFTHPHIQSLLNELFFLNPISVETQRPQTIVLSVSVASVDPSLIGIIRRNSHLPSMESFDKSLSSEAFGSTQFTTELPKILHQPELSKDDYVASAVEVDDALESIRVPDVPKVSPLPFEPIARLYSSVPKVGIQPEQPVVKEIEKSTTSFKMFLSKFKLKITTDLLSGQWD